MRDQSDRLGDLFHAVTKLPQHAREAFLDQRCVSDENLRRDLDSLLAYEDRADNILEQPAVEFAASLIAEIRVHAQLLPGQRIGPYQIESLLGWGGMGEVYRAFDTRLNRPVAIKMIASSPGGPFPVQNRMIAEARAASALTHPNVCTLFDIGEYAGKPFLVMELLDGKTLSEIVCTGPAEYRQLLDWSVQIARGLEAAHAAGIIHCDIKPSNIFITSSGHAKILDFGIARLNPCSSTASPIPSGSGDPAATSTTIRRGTPGYMSPEQAEGKALDARTDLFSMGLVMLEMATGGNSSTRKPAVPGRLESVIKRLRSEKPEDRYRSASELVSDLEHLQSSRPDRLRRMAAMVGVLAIAVAAYVWRRAGVEGPISHEWVQVTNVSDSAVDPALSPDGSLLAFLRGEPTFTPRGRVYLMNLANGESRPVTQDDDSKLMGPVISPDGLTLAWTRIDRNWAWDTWSVPLSGGQAGVMMRNASGLTWTGRGDVLFSEVKSGLHMGLVTADLARKHFRDVYLPSGLTNMVHRSYLSPDGAWVLAAEMNGAGWLPCRLLPFDGSSVGKQVGPAGAGCTSAAWSPDGKWMYFSSSAGSAFHIWRQRFPDGAPHQVTFGGSEEEGIAMSRDGRSLYTSVGTGTSTVYIYDGLAERKLSDEDFSFAPQFSEDGDTVYYLVSPRVKSFWTESGDLWSADVRFGHRRRLRLPTGISSFTVDTNRRRVFFVKVSSRGTTSLWLSPLDGSSTPVHLADEIPHRTSDHVYRPGVVDGEAFLYVTLSGKVYRVDSRGAQRTELLSSPVIGLYDISPHRNWLAVMDATAFEGVNHPTVLYPLNGRSESRIALCVGCAVFWAGGGHYLHVQFPSSRWQGNGSDYLLPVPQGELLPQLFQKGQLVTEEQVANAAGTRQVRQGVIFRPGGVNTYVFTKQTAHRNIFRVPLE